MKNPKPTVYFGAALFNARESVFNCDLAEMLEAKGAQVLLPQRDGFEFSKLQQALDKKMEKSQAANALQTIIYILDIGDFVPRSDVILANLDEPLDEGLIVEIMFGGFMGIPVLGYRTDVRSPFGDLSDPFRGMHFFPAFQCDAFVGAFISAKTPQERKAEMQAFCDRLWPIILELSKSTHRHRHVKIENLKKMAYDLFGGIPDIHSELGLEKIVNRFLSNQEIFSLMWPQIH